MVRGTFSPARAWRPAVVARLARTLGIRRTTVWWASRKCACRRELNSHELPFSVVPQLEADTHSARTSSQISVRAGVSAGQSKCTTAPPKRRKEAAARFGEVVSTRMNEEHGHYRPGVQRSFEVPRSRSQSSGRRCKAHSAMQSPWRAPQTRSTATALAVALSGKQNRLHANTTAAVSPAS